MSDSANSGRPSGFPANGQRLIVLGAVVLVLFILVLTSFFVVDQSETAIVLRFGRFDREVGPGLRWKIPFGIEESLIVPIQRVQKMEFGFRTEVAGFNTRYSSRDFTNESVMLTGDLNIVDIEWEVQYRITDARQWLFNIEDPIRTVRDIGQSVMNQLIGDRAIIEVLSSGRTAIEFEAEQLMNEYFRNYGIGVTVNTVRTQNILPPSGRVQDAFEDVNTAIQDMNRLINEGREAINREIPRARGEAEQVIEVARGYAAERVNRARGDVARFNAVRTEFERNPSVTRTRLYYEGMEDVFKNADKLQLIDKELQNFIPLLNLKGGTQ